MRKLGRVWLPPSSISTPSHPWAPNIALNCLASGPDPRLDPVTTLVIFVHGFPELAYSWRHQLDVVAQCGPFSCIAPDMRGYGKSSTPLDTKSYEFKLICEDLVSLIKVMKRSKAVFVGHDFGGSVVWAMALHHPEVVAGVVGVNTPLMVLDPEMVDVMTRNGGYIATLQKLSSENAGHLDYTTWFQYPGSEKELNADPMRTIHAYFRSQIKDAETNRNNMKLGMRTVKCRDRGGVLTLCAPTIPRDEMWSEEEIAVYVSSFKRTGFPLDWYRCMDANFMWDVREDCFTKKIQVPCMQVCATRDLVLRADQALKMGSRFSPYPLEIVNLDCGHWTMVERTAEFNEALVKYLRLHFGGSSKLSRL